LDKAQYTTETSRELIMLSYFYWYFGKRNYLLEIVDFKKRINIPFLHLLIVNTYNGIT